jgi:DNA-binding NarL/FixJ family response regulator
VFVLERVDRTSLQEVIAAGAQGVLCKPVHREQLEAHVPSGDGGSAAPGRAARAGTTTRGRACSRARCTGSHRNWRGSICPAPPRTQPQPLCGLRPREHEVVRLLLQHLRVPAIARRLGISQQTVRNHLKSVFRRTGVRSQQELLDRIALAARRSRRPRRRLRRASSSAP